MSPADSGGRDRCRPCQTANEDLPKMLRSSLPSSRKMAAALLSPVASTTRTLLSRSSLARRAEKDAVFAGVRRRLSDPPRAGQPTRTVADGTARALPGGVHRRRPRGERRRWDGRGLGSGPLVARGGQRNSERWGTPYFSPANSFLVG